MSQAAHRPESSWMVQGSMWQDVVLSTRIRLARNVSDLPFPGVATSEQKTILMHRVENIVPQLVSESGSLWQLVHMTGLSEEERGVLVDKHLISPQFLKHAEGSSLLLREDEAVSIMMNEEDHLRMQVLMPGQKLSEAWEIATKVDDILEAQLSYAFHPELGYLTACPTNVGTGLRASVMMHLPALVISKKVSDVLAAINKMGFVVRGLYGEGSEATGQIFQISNQISLGHSEEEIMQSLQAIVKQIVEEERNTRRALQNSSEMDVMNRIGRSLGVLANARIINEREALQLLSDLRLGVHLQRVLGISNETISALLVMIHPAWMSLEYPDDSRPMPHKRAQILREAMVGVRLE